SSRGSQPPLAIGVAASSSRGSEPPMAIGVTAPSTAGEIWPEWRKGVHVAWVVSFPIKAARISSTAADQFDLAEKILALCRSNAGLDGCVEDAMQVRAEIFGSCWPEPAAATD
ncbi:unnamed protein product, partial [Polarella glacialis]